MKFNSEQHLIWQTLFANQVENIDRFACSLFREGFRRLKLPSDRIPSLEELNERISPLTGWRVVRTNIRYSDTLTWYQHFARKEFIITSYLRNWSELEFTPEPDMFHDIFGHLPFLTMPEYVEIFDMFTKAYFKANKLQQEEIKRLGWFSYEFGLIKENGQTKIFGAGILSSKGETDRIGMGKTPMSKFSVRNVLERNKAIDCFNEKLFVFESLPDLKKNLKTHFGTFSGELRIEDMKKVIDQEMDMSQYSNAK